MKAKQPLRNAKLAAGTSKSLSISFNLKGFLPTGHQYISSSPRKPAANTATPC